MALQAGVRHKKTELALVYGTGDRVDWKKYRRIECELDRMLKVEEVFWQQRSRGS